MKKLILFLVLFFLIFPSNIFAQDSSMDETASGAGNIALSVKSIEYTLPYPGLLPDNPLYFLKAVRDRIVGILISDPVKKATFDLLQADKHLNEAVYLFAKGEKKYSLAHSTVSKGENYFENGISEIEKAKKQGIKTADVSNKYYTASLKHQEVLQKLKLKSTSEFKNTLSEDGKRIEKLGKRVKDLIP